MRPVIRSVVLCLALLVLASGARAELTPWDQAKVTELAKQLETATGALSDAFRKQPQPTLGSAQRKSFFQLRQEVRQLRRESRSLSRALQQGEGQEETLPSFESMMRTVRSATDIARRTFSGADIQTRADAARDILNQLAPYYDPNFTPLQPGRR
jgi:hypothetical protein